MFIQGTLSSVALKEKKKKKMITYIMMSPKCCFFSLNRVLLAATLFFSLLPFPAFFILIILVLVWRGEIFAITETSPVVLMVWGRSAPADGHTSPVDSPAHEWNDEHSQAEWDQNAQQDCQATRRGSHQDRPHHRLEASVHLPAPATSLFSDSHEAWLAVFLLENVVAVGWRRAGEWCVCVWFYMDPFHRRVISG